MVKQEIMERLEEIQKIAQDDYPVGTFEDGLPFPDRADALWAIGQATENLLFWLENYVIEEVE